MMVCNDCGRPLNTQTGGCNWCSLVPKTPGDGIGGTDGGGSDNVVPFVRDEFRPNLNIVSSSHLQMDVIAELAQLLAEAQAGKITGLAHVVFYGEGSFSTGTKGKVGYTRLVGGLEDLKFEIMQQHRNQSPRPLK